MSFSTETAVVRRNDSRSRYEILLDDEVVGFADYHDRGSRRVFPHTEVRSSHEGKGLGGRLVEAALEDTRSAGLRVSPRCSFVADYIDRHPEYADLVAG